MGKTADLTGKQFSSWKVIRRSGLKHRRWVVQCACGVESTRDAHSLTSGYSKMCEDCAKSRPKGPRRDLKGEVFGRLTVVKHIYVPKRSGGLQLLWECECKCGNIISIITSSLTTGNTKSCGCVRKLVGAEHYKWGGHGEISGDFWYTIKQGAIERELTFDLSIEDAWQLFLNQERKCALSQWPINFAPSLRRHLITASLDRIDSNKGYYLENVQWIHKDINRMKNSFEQAYFIEVCKAVAMTSSYVDARAQALAGPH